MNTIDLSGEEASILIESTLDALYRRVRWSIGHDGQWRALDFEHVKMYLGALSTLHMKGWMVLKDTGDVVDAFEKAFMIPDDVWDVIDSITSAESWGDVPKHLHSPSLCRVCRTLSQHPSNLVQ